MFELQLHSISCLNTMSISFCAIYCTLSDDFELLWPATYAQIGKSFGGASVINMAKQPGDLQFLCTDSGTSRANKITHVTMVATPTQIVHARGTKYGVCTNSISLYAGKVCGVVRYNPACALRLGMKGYRTLRLQQALNLHGADISEDGEFGEKTQKALKVFQADHGLSLIHISAQALDDLYTRDK